MEKNKEKNYACNFCKASNFTEIIDLGMMPIAHLKSDSDQFKPSFKHQLVLDMCNDCGLIQIKDPIPKEQLYINYNSCFITLKPHPHIPD